MYSTGKLGNYIYQDHASRVGKTGGEAEKDCMIRGKKLLRFSFILHDELQGVNFITENNDQAI